MGSLYEPRSQKFKVSKTLLRVLCVLLYLLYLINRRSEVFVCGYIFRLIECRRKHAIVTLKKKRDDRVHINIYYPFNSEDISFEIRSESKRISLQILFKISFVNLHERFETICTDSKRSTCWFSSLVDVFFCFCRKIFLRCKSDISTVEIGFESLSTRLFGFVDETISCQEMSSMRSVSWWIDWRNKEVCCSRVTDLDLEVSSITSLTVRLLSNDFRSYSRTGSWLMLWWEEISGKLFIKFLSDFDAAIETGLLIRVEYLDGVSGSWCRSDSGMVSQTSTCQITMIIVTFAIDNFLK